MADQEIEQEVACSVDEGSAPLPNGGAGWARRGKCTPEKALEKLRWMGERVRHPEGSQLAQRMMERAIAQFEQELERER